MTEYLTLPQAFGNGIGPFFEHLADEDFLHAVRSLCVFYVPVNPHVFHLTSLHVPCHI